ncbi:MAG: cupin domain-containing protein [Caldilineaceae bacterium]
MIIRNDHYMIVSQNSNQHYWEQDVYPSWTQFTILRHFPDQRIGAGVEPHYHDCDEIWLFSAGHGEVWLDEERFPITPNTLVYTPMGVIHHFQMYTNGENNALVTRLERQKRPIHILVEEAGPPEKTVPGFVIAGNLNIGPIPNPGTRCPFTELRMITLASGEMLEQTQLPNNEHWLVLEGVLHLMVGESEFELYKGDVALLRAGLVRRLGSSNDGRVLFVRERGHL